MIEYRTERFYRSVYHDPEFDGYLKSDNLIVDQSGSVNVVEFQDAQINGLGMTFGASPFSQSSNLRLTTRSGNPAAGSSFFDPMFLGEFPQSLMKSLANNNRSYVLFAIPFASQSSDDTIYMVGYYTNITWAGGNNDIYYYFKVSFIKNSYNPDTASGADKLYNSSWSQRALSPTFSSYKVLFSFSRLTAQNDNNQFIPASVAEAVDFVLDRSVFVFSSMSVHNFNDASTLPGLGDSVKYQIATSTRALQAAPQPGADLTMYSGLMFVAPAYAEYALNCKGDYQSKLISDEVGEVSEPGGYENGTFEYEHDGIDISPAPTIGISTSGMYHVYRIYQQQLVNIGAEILGAPGSYTPQYSAATTEVDAIKEFSDFMQDILGIQYTGQSALLNNSRLIDYVIDLHMIPVTPSTSANENIKLGWKTLETIGAPVTNDYVDVSCGTVQTKEFYGMFADYLTRVKLFLPFIGFVPVQPEWFQNATIGIKYRFNVIDGSFICWIYGYGAHINKGFDFGYKSGVLAQYSGAACIHMPITGANYAAMLGGQLAAVGGVLASAAYGNIAGAAGSALNAIMMKPEIAQSNAYSSSAAILSHRTPFFMISRPTSHYSELYQHEQGLPANITSRLGDLQGFVQMSNTHIETLSRATIREKEIVRKKLAEGIIVS